MENIMEKRGAIEIENLDKAFGENHVVNHISLSINAGEFISFLGPSGCGKTTILRMIAGFETIDGGDIKIDGESVIHLPPHKRQVNTVFQHYALFPHLNVYDNVAYGLKAKNVSKAKIKEEVTKALELVQLDGFEKRMISQMSGGQKQRVSIARAIVNKPPVLLLDEPLTALDMKLRKEMRYELRNIQQKLGITFIYVTHDQEEAMVMSDRIVVLNGGNIEQVGKPKEIYQSPRSAFVSDFIGETNSFDGMIYQVQGDLATLQCESGQFMAKTTLFKEKEFVNISIRPHQVKWKEEMQEGFHLKGVVKDYIFTGSFVNAVVELVNGREVRIARLAGEGLPKVGQTVFLYWNPEDTVVMKNPAGDFGNMMENMDLGEWVKK
ncbi:MAG: ABC transporter ATP-binding protein [Lachnospiraceae bacterium]|nr:ABC transporter ATP-binding protein [Lachnospiraceae bacterium]